MDQLTPAIQESLLALMCYDDAHGKTVRALVNPSVFDVYFRDIAEHVDAYWTQYKRPPLEHTLDLIDTIKARKQEAADVFERLYRSIESTRAGGINAEYILAQTSAFARKQRLTQAIQRAVETLEAGLDGHVDEAEGILTKAIRTTTDEFDRGMLFNDPTQSLTFLKRDENVEFFPTGVGILDQLGLTPARKEMWLMMAGLNRGKSWGLVSLGKHGLLHKKRVLHITCEMTKEQVAQRYVQSFFSVSQFDEVVKRMMFDVDDKGRFLGMDEEEMKKRPAFADSDIREFLSGRFEGLKRRPPLRIKEMPTGTATVDDVLRYLDALESTERFIPDEILIDYPDLFKIDPKYKQAMLTTIYTELRGRLAMERNVALGVVTQSTRSGLKKKVIDEGDVADDINKFRIADIGITYNQTDEEERMGLARLFVARARTKRKHQHILISQAYAVGQFCLDSVMMNDSYWQYVDRSDDGLGDDDE